MTFLTYQESQNKTHLVGSGLEWRVSLVSYSKFAPNLLSSPEVVESQCNNSGRTKNFELGCGKAWLLM